MYSLAPGHLLVLASSSPRRRELIGRLGVPFSVQSSEVEEEVLSGESPEAMVRRLAEAKALAVARTLRERTAVVIGADTTVEVGGAILNKPLDHEDAVRMLSALSGAIHRVWGGICIVRAPDEVVSIEAHCTAVKMCPLSTSMIQRYIETGEPLDKAGAYGIQEIGAHLIERVEGSYTNVVGLNVSAVVRSLRDAGILLDSNPR